MLRNWGWGTSIGPPGGRVGRARAVLNGEMSHQTRERDAWDQEAVELAQTCQEPVSAGVKAERQLRAHFMGKRDGYRQCVELELSKPVEAEIQYAFDPKVRGQ